MSTKKGGASRPWYQATSCARNPLRNPNRFENYRGPTTLGGMPMNSSLASTDFSHRGRKDKCPRRRCERRGAHAVGGVVPGKEPRKGGVPRLVPTDDERLLVTLLVANGCAQHLICGYISNRRGPHTSESTLKRAFTQELNSRMVELCASWRGSCAR